MIREIIVAGFGGQGVITIGKMLAEGGLHEGYHITWVPSYGPEMRGGTANCSVVISDEAIGSPVFSQPGELIAMNGPSLKKFLPHVRPGGLVLINDSQASEAVQRQDIRVLRIPLMAMANELGSLRSANMIMLGAYVAVSGALNIDSMDKVMEEMFAGAKAQHLPLNLKALHAGADWARQRQG